jgi:hypothetical protein
MCETIVLIYNTEGERERERENKREREREKEETPNIKINYTHLSSRLNKRNFKNIYVIFFVLG